MNVLLSIKPSYVDAIVRGIKRYEFRKTPFKNENIEKVFIYSMSPVKKIVGTFRIGKVIEAHPEQLWDQLKEESGLNDVEFFGYFNGRKSGVAIEIESVEQFDEPIDPRELIPDFVPPQSFRYVDSQLLVSKLVKRDECDLLGDGNGEGP